MKAGAVSSLNSHSLQQNLTGGVRGWKTQKFSRKNCDLCTMKGIKCLLVIFFPPKDSCNSLKRKEYRMADKINELSYVF